MSNIQVNTWLANSPDEVESAERWQVLRELNAEEYAALKSGIAERGIDHALALDSNGNLIDGHHRLKIWAELIEERVEVPPVTVKQYELTDPNEIRLLARKLNMQRRQLTTVEKREVVKDQLRETWNRSDTWIGDDLGVEPKTVKARRRELVADREFHDLPEKVIGRDGSTGDYEVPQRKAKSKSKSSKQNKPAKESPEQTTVEEQVEAAKQESPQTIEDAVDVAIEQAKQNGTAPESTPSWPSHPSQEQESKEAQRVRQISAWMAGLSQIDPEEAADLVSARADVDARLVIAEEVIDWFEKYREALKAKSHQPSLQAVK